MDGIGQNMVFKEINGQIGRNGLKMLLSTWPSYP